MAITSYSELKLAVANWLGREELTNRIPEFIAMAEDRIAMDLRVQAMETTANLTISTQRVSFPTGFLEARRLYLDSSYEKPLDYFSPAVFWTRGFANETGQPDAYTIEGQEFVFAPSPSASVTGKLLYYKRFTALSAAGDTNWILSNARGLLLYGALVEAYMFLEDDAGALKMAAMYDQLLSRVTNADKIGRVPKGAQPMRSQVAVV
jgi:hypothetical protein